MEHPTVFISYAQEGEGRIERMGAKKKWFLACIATSIDFMFKCMSWILQSICKLLI